MWEKVCGKAVLFQSQEENQEWYGNNFCGEHDVYFKPWLGIHLATPTRSQVVAQPGKNAEMLSPKAGKHKANFRHASLFLSKQYN